jgi:hypothetical protein
LILAFAFFLFRKPNKDPIRYENYAKIEIGMTRTEVSELLGCGPGTLETWDPQGPQFITICSGRPRDRRGDWKGEHKWIHIEFVDDRVAEKSIHDKVILEESWPGWFRRRLGINGSLDYRCQYEWARAD